MTLRVTLEIIPYGDETGKYEIGSLDISNIRGAMGYCEYRATQFSDGHTVLKQTIDGSLTHDRRNGAWVLVKKAIESLDI
mgnify:CR=1 FL=1